VGVLVDRRGAVTHVMAGDAASIVMPDWGRMRAGLGRLRGVRCLHTTLGGEPLTRDDLTDLAKLRLDAMATIEVREDGLPGPVHVAALSPSSNGNGGIERLAPTLPSQLELDFQGWIRALEDELARTRPVRAVDAVERAILVVITAGRDRGETDYSTDELRELARSAGVEVVDVLVQNRPQADPKTAIGSGKLQDLMIRCFQSDVDLVIFDDELTAVQARNLAERLDLRVILHDRNCGRGTTVSDGFRAARGGIAGYLDVDLEVHSRYIPSLVRAIRNGADVATVRRIYAFQMRALDRYFMSRGYSYLVRRLLRVPFHDTETGYKFCRREALLPLLDEIHDGGWFWDTEFMVRAAGRGLRIREIPGAYVRRWDKHSKQA
jgi:GTP-binding protein HflX